MQNPLKTTRKRLKLLKVLKSYILDALMFVLEKISPGVKIMELCVEADKFILENTKSDNKEIKNGNI